MHIVLSQMNQRCIFADFPWKFFLKDYAGTSILLCFIYYYYFYFSLGISSKFIINVHISHFKNIRTFEKKLILHIIHNWESFWL